jgi:integrase/recombinase XerD
VQSNPWKTGPGKAVAGATAAVLNAIYEEEFLGFSYGFRPKRSQHTLLGPWIRRFLLEHVLAERNLSRNTQHSYRDAISLLIPFVAKARKKPVDRLGITDVSADFVRLFLADIETSCHCSIAIRNQRLAAIRAFASFVGEHSPILIEWSGQVRSIPFKKTGKAVIPYLDKPEMDALLAGPDCRTAQGRREHALLLFLYNSGARATEAAQLKIDDLDIRAACVRISGKGGKRRLCPLWPATVAEIVQLIAGRTRTRNASRVILRNAWLSSH